MFSERSLDVFIVFDNGGGQVFITSCYDEVFFCLSSSKTFSLCLFKLPVGIGFLGLYRVQSYQNIVLGVLLLLGIS